MAYINEIFHFALVWRSRRDRSKPVTFKAQEMVMVFGGRRGHHYKRSIMKEAWIYFKMGMEYIITTAVNEETTKVKV